MTIGTAGSGFVSFDLKTHHKILKSIKEEIGTLVPPGYAAKPRFLPYKWCGAALAIGDTEEWKSYGTEFHQLKTVELTGNVGVLFLGALTGYVGIKGEPSPLIGSRLRSAAKKFCYELPSRLIPKPEILKKHHENALYSVFTTQIRTRPINPDDVKNLETIIGIMPEGHWWGRQYAHHLRPAHKAVKGMKDRYKPRGPFITTCGWRAWALTSIPAKRSAKWKTRLHDHDVKEKAEDVLKAYKRYTVFEKVWWGGEWLDTD